MRIRNDLFSVNFNRFVYFIFDWCDRKCNNMISGNAVILTEKVCR